MPSPLLHSAAGLAIYSSDRSALEQNRRRFLVLILLAAMIADLDFLFGLFMADPNRFHAGVTHSLGIAVLVGLAGALAAGVHRFRLGILCFTAYASHAILDSLTRDARPPLGVPLLWPLTQRHFNLPLVDGISHGASDASVGEFLREIFSSGNISTVIIEAAIGVVLVLAGMGIGSIRARRRNDLRGSLRNRRASTGPREDA